MGWSHVHTGLLRIGRDISTAKVSPEEQGVLDPHQNSQPRVPVPGKEVPIISGCENQWGLLMSEAWLLESQAFVLKGPHMDLIQMHSLSSSSRAVAGKVPWRNGEKRNFWLQVEGRAQHFPT